jgi:hypothetical protein
MSSGARGALKSLALICLTSASALACSGPEAQAAMDRASLVGAGCYLLSLVATVVAIIRARRFKTKLAKFGAAFAVLLLFAHPTIWLGVTSGDCGNTLLFVGPATALVHAAIAAFLLLKKPEQH